MKLTPLLLLALLPISALAAEPSITVHTQLCELRGDVKLPKDITQILKHPKADTFTAPDTATPSGEPAKVSITREFQVPGKGAFPVGMSLSIRPTLDGDRFRYSVDFERTEFLSYAARSATEAPILNTQKIIGMDGQCAGGETVWLDLGTREEKQVVSEPGKRDRTQTVQRRLIAILTFNKA